MQTVPPEVDRTYTPFPYTTLFRSLPMCQITKMEGFPPEDLVGGVISPRCASCFDDGARLFQPLGLDVHLYSQLLPADADAVIGRIVEAADPGRLKELTILGCRIGEHAFAGKIGRAHV